MNLLRFEGFLLVEPRLEKTSCLLHVECHGRVQAYAYKTGLRQMVDEGACMEIRLCYNALSAHTEFVVHITSVCTPVTLCCSIDDHRAIANRRTLHLQWSTASIIELYADVGSHPCMELLWSRQIQSAADPLKQLRPLIKCNLSVTSNSSISVCKQHLLDFFHIKTGVPALDASAIWLHLHVTIASSV